MCVCVCVLSNLARLIRLFGIPVGVLKAGRSLSAISTALSFSSWTHKDTNTEIFKLYIVYVRGCVCVCMCAHTSSPLRAYALNKPPTNLILNSNTEISDFTCKKKE